MSTVMTCEQQIARFRLRELLVHAQDELQQQPDHHGPGRDYGREEREVGKLGLVEVKSCAERHT